MFKRWKGGCYHEWTNEAGLAGEGVMGRRLAVNGEKFGEWRDKNQRWCLEAPANRLGARLITSSHSACSWCANGCAGGCLKLHP